MSDNWFKTSPGEDFLKKLRVCCDRIEHPNLTKFDDQFITSLKIKFNSRADAIEIGVTPWTPTAKQINYLNDLYGKIR